MEVLSFGGILLIVLYFLMIRQDLGQTLPVIALYAFAGYRLMPALQGKDFLNDKRHYTNLQL